MKKFNNIPVRIIIRSDENYSRFIYAFADFVLLNISFFIMNFIRSRTFIISPDYIRLLFFFYAVWFFSSFITKKYSIKPGSLLDALLVQVKTMLLVAYFISFLIVFLRLTSYSRVHVFGTCLIMLFLELFLFSLVSISKQKSSVIVKNKMNETLFRNQKVSVFLFFGDFMLLTFAFFILNLYKKGTITLTPECEKLLLLIYGFWMISALITRKFNIHNFQNVYYAIVAGVKSIFIMVFSLSFIIFALRLFEFSRLHIFGTFLLFGFLEIVLTFLYFIFKFGEDLSGDIESIAGVQDFFSQKNLSLERNRRKPDMVGATSFMNILSERYIKSVSGLSDFIGHAVDLSNIDGNEKAIFNSSDFFNLQILKRDSTRLIINLYKLNDIRWINRYFLEIHNRLLNGGYFIGRADTIAIHKRRFFQKYPRYLAELLYVLHFMFFRIFPKLPRLRKIYFVLTKGKGRMISRAEVLGRLCFCGFKIVAEKEIGSSLFFIAQKIRTPSQDLNPSYGFIIKLKRFGLHGQPIEVYKFRTMYPYSEYLQEYIYEHQKLEDGGKIKKDFRVTEWGRFMRRYWIDELPMLFNWIRGDIKIFGVRPLSKHYLNLYDNYVKKIRNNVKPGLIPPYYADLPKRLEDITESEKRYLQAYQEHPFKTQINYLFKVLNNIFFKGARSA